MTINRTTSIQRWVGSQRWFVCYFKMANTVIHRRKKMRNLNSTEDDEIIYKTLGKRMETNIVVGGGGEESKGFLCSKLAERSTRREMLLSFLLHILGQPISRVVVLTGNSTFWEKEDQYIELTENLIILI